MSTVVGWDEIAVRLILTIVASALIGLDRGEHGRPAGLRTTILVGLAAAASMIQVNLLLGVAGKPHDSFIVMDLMRLPLGILSGMGFIGGGAILRRDKMVTGVTTAATLWFTTVMGLCFGGGQLLLGVAMLGTGLVVLLCLRWIEDRIHRDRRATLAVAMGENGPTEDQIREKLLAAQFKIVSLAVTRLPSSGARRIRCELIWHASPSDSRTPPLVDRLAALPGVKRVSWQP
ncbi:MAG TPA: MgtC/SapB family protein [Pirellulales bacterium]|nr:MgtC/SapB family protein [Pirellulales bacterium]